MNVLLEYFIRIHLTALLELHKVKISEGISGNLLNTSEGHAHTNKAVTECLLIVRLPHLTELFR